MDVPPSCLGGGTFSVLYGRYTAGCDADATKQLVLYGKASVEARRNCMKRRITRLILVSLVSVSVCMTAGCQKYEGKKETGTNQYQGDDKTDDGLVTLKEIRASKDKVMEDALNGRWSNLVFDNLEPYITDKDEIYNIQLTSQKYKGLTREKLFDEMLKAVYKCYPNADEGVFMDSSQMGDDGQILKIDLEEHRKRLSDENNTGDFVDYPTLYMEIKDGNPIHKPQIFYTDGAFDDFRVDRKLIKNTKLDSMGLEESIPVPGLNVWFCDNVKDYYASAKDGSLDEEWQLLDGKMSVREGIEYIEEYINNELPYETNPDIHMDVYGVTVLKVTDDVYAYHFRLRREIYGLVTNCGFPVMHGDVAHLAENGDAEIIEHNSVDTFSTLRNCQKTEKIGEPITEIVSLENAVDIVSKEIGENSSYRVHTVELAYESYAMGAIGCTAKAWPVWKFEVDNPKNEKSYLFIVDAVTGKITSREY